MPERVINVQSSTVTETLVLRLTPAGEGAPAVAEARRIPEVQPLVTVRELAQRIGMDRSACRKYVLRIGYKPALRRTGDSGFQMALCVTATDARAIQALRASEGYCSPPT